MKNLEFNEQCAHIQWNLAIPASHPWDNESSLISEVAGIQGTLLPVSASEQGNVIGFVRIYICVCTKKNCN